MAESQHKSIAKLYKRKQVESASPAQLIVMLYDAALDQLGKAELAMEDTTPRRIEKYHNALIACQNIITELISSLDLEKGGEIATNLFNLYDYMIYRLVDANIKKDDGSIHEVRDLLTTLRSSWVEILNREKNVRQQPPPNAGLNLQG